MCCVAVHKGWTEVLIYSGNPWLDLSTKTLSDEEVSITPSIKSEYFNS